MYEYTQQCNLYSTKGRANSHSFPPEPAPFSLSRLIIVIAIAVLMIVVALFNVELNTGSPHTEDGIQGIDENQSASGTGTDPQSSGAEQIAIVGGVVLSFAMIAGGIILNELQKPEPEINQSRRAGK